MCPNAKNIDAFTFFVVRRGTDPIAFVFLYKHKLIPNLIKATFSRLNPFAHP